MKAKTYKDSDLRNLVSYFGCIHNYARIMRGEDPVIAILTKEDYAGYEEAIRVYSASLDNILTSMGESKESIQDNLRESLLEKTGYFLDFHPNLAYKKPPMKNKPLVYLGRVIEKETRKIKDENHTFLRCRSNEEGPGIPYPVEFQPNQCQIYTSGNITWMDYSGEIKNQEFREFEGQNPSFQEIPQTPNEIFRDLSNNSLIDLINRGKVNYQNLSKKSSSKLFLDVFFRNIPLRFNHQDN